MSEAEWLYPATRYAPTPLADLEDKAQRERLSASALKGFFNLVDRWGLRDEAARGLLGGLSNGAYYKWKRDPSSVFLSGDVLTRISYLLGIYKALHILYGDSLADEWVSLPNQNRIFGGQSPLAFMLSGGIAAMQTVRRLLDARRGGL